MAVLERNISARSPQAAAPAEQSESGNLQLSRFSSEDLAQFAGGVRSILNVLPQENLQDIYNATHQLDRENMTPGEMLITYDVMHNPVMEAIASVHAKDAIAFANDVMINLIQVERLQQNNQSIGNPYDWDDDDDTDPETKARKRDERLQQALTNMFQDAHEERMERERKEWQAKWDKQMHRIGNKEYSGAQLHALHEWFSDPDNQDAFEQNLVSSGVSKEDAKKRAQKLQRTLELLEKERQQRLTEEERLELERNKRDRQVAEDLERIQGMNEQKNTLEASQQNAQTRNAETNDRKDSRVEDNSGKIGDRFNFEAKLNKAILLHEKQRTGELSSEEKKELTLLMENQNLANLISKIEQQSKETARPIELVHQNSIEITQPTAVSSAKPELSQNIADIKSDTDPNSLSSTYNPLAQAKTNDNAPTPTQAPPPQKLLLAQVSTLDF